MTLVDAAILGQRAGRYGGHRPHWMGLVFLSLLVALVIAGIVALIIWISRTRHPAHPVAAAPAPPVSAASAATAARTDVLRAGRCPPHPRRAPGARRDRAGGLPGAPRGARELIVHRTGPLPVRSVR